jgi:Putative prokaryotic signal transducing protein
MLISGMNFICIRGYDNYINAHMQLGMLQEEGINCHLKDEYSVTIDPFLSAAIGGIKLMVAESQAKRAVELLNETG